MAETIGNANVILGADTSALEAGLDAAKDKVRSQTQEIQSSVDATGSMSDEERYLATLRQKQIDLLVQRNAELAKTKQLEEAARVAAANEARIAEEQALAEEQRYQNALLEKAVELEYQKREAAAAAAAATQQQTEDLQKATDEKKVDEDAGILGFLKGASKEAQQLKKLLGTFGKLAIFTAVVKGAYEAGAAIREYVVKALKSAEDKAEDFRLSLDFKDANQSLKLTNEQIDKLNEKIEAMTGDDIAAKWARLVGLMKLETVGGLKEEVAELQNDIGRYNREIEGRRRKAIVEQELLRREALIAENNLLEAQLSNDPRIVAVAEYEQKVKEVEEEIAKTRDDVIKTELYRKLGNLSEEHTARLQAIKDEEEAAIEAEKNINRERANGFRRDANGLEAKRKGRSEEFNFLQEMNDLREQLMNASTQDEADAILKLMREKALAFQQLQEDATIDAVATRRDEETKLLSEREQLEERLNKRVQALRDKAESLRRAGFIEAAYEMEEAATAAGETRIRELAEFDQKLQRDTARKQQQLIEKQQSQIEQMRGQIDKLFNSGNMEVGVERVGALIQTLIDKMENTR